MFKEGDILCSKYKLKKRFNGGGFSSVWLATDLKAQVDFALKIYDNIEEVELFKKGFRLVYKLNHSNIFTPLAYDVHEGKPFLVMTYLPNGSVSGKIGKMSEDEVWRFVHDVAAGLAYLHDNKGIVHQDIKPGNILIDDDGKFMITDFDISTRQSSTVRMTARQVEEMQDFNYGSGTPDYMGPERWPDNKTGYRPSLKPMQASDIWSLGATLFELMEGRMPFGETGGAYQRSLCKKLESHGQKGNAIPKMTSNYSKELKKLASMCLSKDAWDRPSAQQIADGATRHKAPSPRSGATPVWFKYAIICGVAAAVIALAVLSLLNSEVQPSMPQYRDSIYLVCIDSATEIVRKQLEQQVSDNGYSFDIEKVAEAYGLYAQADTMALVTDSTKEKGRELWAESQGIINNEYRRLDSLEQRYKRMDATEAALNFARRRYDIEKFVTNK